jgi:hypothetical protein
MNTSCFKAINAVFCFLKIYLSITAYLNFYAHPFKLPKACGKTLYD